MYSMSADLLNMRCELWDRDGGARSRPHTAREIMHIAISEGSFWARASRDRDERRDPAGAAARTSTTAHPHTTQPHTSLPDRRTVHCAPALLLIPDIMPFGAGAGGQRRPQRRRRRPRARGEVRGDTGGERAAGGQGRAPLQLTVAGMLTHAHASTVSYAGMTPRADT